MNYAAIFPACRAVVHHGGAGTTAASLRAGVPTLILSTDHRSDALGSSDQTTQGGHRPALFDRYPGIADRGPAPILAPHYATRAREIATQITKPAEAVAAAADLSGKSCPRQSSMTGHPIHHRPHGLRSASKR